MKIAYSADTCFGLYYKMIEISGVEFSAQSHQLTRSKFDDEIT